MKININDYVKVKLNQQGREIYFHLYDEQRKDMVARKGYYPQYLQPQYPSVDAEGYSRFQLWDFIQIYGDYMRLGFNLPFDAELIFERGEA